MTAIANLIGESVWISQYNPKQQAIGFVTYINGVVGDADAPPTVTMETIPEDGSAPTQIFSRAATKVDTGTYEITPSGAEAEDTGFYKLTWNYDISAVNQTFAHALEVVPSSQALEVMPDEFKPILDAVWMRFSDLFDSPFGGPHLQVYYQTRFNRNRVAQLIGTGIRRLNVLAQPQMTYGATEADGNLFPVATWGGLLEQITYVEVLKHLVRSYVEQPDTPGVTVARLDRSKYKREWESILQSEQRDLDEMLDHFKIRHMGLGRPQVMVSGGVYGSYGPTRFAGSAAARPRYYWRFH